MEKRKVIFGVLAVLICIGLAIPFMARATEGKVFNWTKEGISPFWGKPLRSEADLKALFNDEAFKSKQRRNLKTVEPTWDTKEVVRLAEVAVMNGEAQRVIFSPGSPEAEFDWMLYGSSGKTGATLWNGSHNLSGFLVPIVYQGESINLFYANACVNVLKKKHHRKAEVPPGEYGTRPPPPVQYESETVIQEKIVEKPVYIDRPVYVDRPIYEVIEKPVYIPVPQYESGGRYGSGYGGYGSGFPLPPPPIFGGYSGGSGGYNGGGNYNYNYNYNNNYSYNRGGGNYRRGHGGHRGGGRRSCQRTRNCAPDGPALRSETDRVIQQTGYSPAQQSRNYNSSSRPQSTYVARGSQSFVRSSSGHRQKRM